MSNNIIITKNPETGFIIEHEQSYDEEVIFSKNRIGQRTQIETRGFSSDDFRKLADYLDTIRSKSNS